jgi:hypothetical protein
VDRHHRSTLRSMIAGVHVQVEMDREQLVDPHQAPQVAAMAGLLGDTEQLGRLSTKTREAAAHAGEGAAAKGGRGTGALSEGGAGEAGRGERGGSQDDLAQGTHSSALRAMTRGESWRGPAPWAGGRGYSHVSRGGGAA